MNPTAVFQFSLFLFPTPVPPADQLGTGLDISANLPGATRVSFAEVTGLASEMDVERYQEGGRNGAPLKFRGVGRFPNLVCRRGVTTTSELWDWYFQTQFTQETPFRRNGFVILHARGGAATGALAGFGPPPVAAWFFLHALPEKLQGPSLNARANEIAIETLELSHEGLLRIRDTDVPGLATAV